MTTRPTARPAPRDYRIKKRHWFMAFGANSLLISILVHLFFGVGATYLIVQHFQKKHVNFNATEPPAQHTEVEHKVQLAKKNSVESAPPDLKRITTTEVSAITLPDVPEMSLTENLTPTTMSGVDGVMGSGLGGGKGSGGTGGAQPLFGAPGGNGLEGTLYDFTRTKDGQPIQIKNTKVSGAIFGPIVRGFVQNQWKPAQDCFESPNKIYTKHLFVPITHDEEAGAAFGSPESSHAFWLVHYQGTIAVVSTKSSGRYRFVGFGDNVLVVGINGTVVLDGSDLQYLKRGGANKYVNRISMEGSVPKPIYAGDWIALEAGQTYKIDILIGDEGVLNTSGLFIQHQADPDGKDLQFAQNGAPKIPLFMIDDLNDEDKKFLSTWLSQESYTPDIVFSLPADQMAP